MILTGNAIDMLKTLPTASVQTCVTSPPYWALRDYGVAGQLGAEDSPGEYVDAMVAVFDQVYRVLADDGTLWLNLGDSYARAGGTTDTTSDQRSRSLAHMHSHQRRNTEPPTGFKHKDLVGIPWRVAFALQAAGWYLRQDIIWNKPNAMPESVTDRCTKSHEYLFLLSKSSKYYFDHDAIKEPAVKGWAGSEFHTGKTGQHQLGRSSTKPRGREKLNGESAVDSKKRGFGNYCGDAKDGMRNKRSVWTVSTKPFKGAHFATFPPKLIEPCILAGCPRGGTVLDPFFGSGTTGVVAKEHGRKYIGIELNPEYVRLAEDRLHCAQLSLEAT